MSVASTLALAAKQIESPDRWVKRSYALDSWGTVISPTDPRACRFCLVGAICSTGEEPLKAFYYLRDYLGELPEAFNDDPNRTHEHVISVLRSAAKKAAEEGE